MKHTEHVLLRLHKGKTAAPHGRPGGPGGAVETGAVSMAYRVLHLVLHFA